jgi:non-specific serine/threonine protein kinase/serine/threonine-protein kinase
MADEPPDDQTTSWQGPAGPDAPPPPGEAPSSLHISGYEVVRRLGEGGMGEVWEAEQLVPVRRRVALKVIKWGMDTREVVARFASERQALAVMNHPCIAKVFDAGSTPEGRPFFTMEFVPGVPLTHYCDAERLTNRARLELFVQVCEGVQHAHQKGIIHRDLKPSNVLVSLEDGRPLPKIIDFGVAKATEKRQAQHTLFTELGQVLGTPSYMSPEQADLASTDIDTRTDVYSLGVMLYELLAGVLPFDPRELRQARFDEVLRRIREQEPPRPSTRVQKAGAESTATARTRRTEVPALRRELKGDLDWIVMKALEKDRARRYETSSALAQDIQRFLHHEPVRARPPSAAYRARRFVRRHRVGVAAASLLLVALVLGVVGTTVGLVRARRAEAQAQEEAATARRVSEFLVRLFEVSDPGEARGNTVTAREILDRGAQKIRAELKDEPVVQARLMDTMGKVYDSLGLYEGARPLLEEALARREARLGPEHLEVSESASRLGDLLRKQGRYPAAEPLLKRALGIREKALPPEDGRIADSINNLAVLYENAGRYAEAEPLHERALRIREKAGDEAGMARTLQNLGVLLARQGKPDAAEPHFRRVLEIDERTLGPDHPDVGTACNNLAILFKQRRRYAEAEPLYARALAIRRRALGPSHPGVADTLNNLGNLHLEQGHYAEAEPLYREALGIYEKALGPGHPSLGRTLDNLAQLQVRLGRHAAAEDTYLRALGLREKALRADHPEIATNLYNLAELRHERKRYAEAEHGFRRSLAIREKVIGPDSPITADSLYALGIVLRDRGRRAEALPPLARAFDIRVANLPAEDRDRVEATEAYAGLLAALGRKAEAEAARRKGVAAGAAP